jgi:hypothetical protein
MMMGKTFKFSRTENGIPFDVTWDDFRYHRQSMFSITDLWYLHDRWIELSTTKKGELNSYRNWMRTAPDVYETANEAMDDFPTSDWF